MDRGSGTVQHFLATWNFYESGLFLDSVRCTREHFACANKQYCRPKDGLFRHKFNRITHWMEGNKMKRFKINFYRTQFIPPGFSVFCNDQFGLTAIAIR
jgi:hypothetical protein